jgi:endonuclease G, mitochondrial
VALETLNLASAVRRAQSRADAQDDDLKELRRRIRERDPTALDNPIERDQRRQFLESLYGEQRDAQLAYERIIGGNELQDSNYLARGDLVARTVVRIGIRSGGRPLGWGTGFLIGDGVLLTNHHVLSQAELARGSQAQAFYDRMLDGTENEPRTFALEPERLFYANRELDFAVVAVAPKDVTGRFALADLGWLPLIAQQGKVVPGEWLTIIQHPKGERKQLAARENQLLKCEGDLLWYSSDTLGGSSGSPVLNNDWLVVALHHSGVPETRNGIWQTIDGRDYRQGVDSEDKIKWIANEGIRISKIVERLRIDPATADHPLVRAVVTHDVSDIRYRVPVMTASGKPPPPSKPATPPSRPPEERAMTTRRIEVTLEIDDSGRVSLVGGGAAESWLEATGSMPKKNNVIDAPVEPHKDWAKGNGYDPDFLQGGPDCSVHLPVVTQTDKIAPLKNAYGFIYDDAEARAGVLEYLGYSVVMNKDRRLAFFSAANIDGAMRPNVSGRDDRWLYDDRISRDHQLDNSYYRGSKERKNKFDRGHLTRRDDMEWGSTVHEAVRRANGTLTWPNCAPQHEVFNQNRDPAQILWGGLEKYVLEQNAAEDRFRLQVFSGPVFGGTDPEFRGLPYPLDYWKIIVGLRKRGGKDELFALGFVLSQEGTIDAHGLEFDPVPEGLVAAQRTIKDIEDLTALEFRIGPDDKPRPLSTVDAYAAKWTKRRRNPRAATRDESFGMLSPGLSSLDDIIM